MKKLLLVFFVCLFFALPSSVSAQQLQSVSQEFAKAKVTRVISETPKIINKKKNPCQILGVMLINGSGKGKTITIEHGCSVIMQSSQKVTVGQTIVVSKLNAPDGKTSYTFVDAYRINTLLTIILAFFALVAIIAGRRGIGSIVGLIISLVVITKFIVPMILSGHDPLLISIIGSLVILVTTIYLAHGFSQRTTVAIGATFISLAITGICAVVFVGIARLSGLGSEDIYALQQGFGSTINYQGLLLGGIIIGALGVLDDITTTQAATVYTLSETDPKLSFVALAQKGFAVGREHITSLVNTLVLAYAGASIGVFIYLILALQSQSQPLWVILNSEIIVEEVIRTLAGSIGLILAVPITTLLAAFFAKYSLKII